MNRVVSVDKSLISGGTVTWFVTLESGDGAKTRIEVGEKEAKRFEEALNSQSTLGETRLLTETMPLT